MIRQYSGTQNAPRWLQEIITRRYGTNPFGEPLYRIVWAPQRLEQSGGTWCDFTLDNARRGYLIRRRLGMRWVPKYGLLRAWIIEQWHPASNYGSPRMWYDTTSNGGTMLWTDMGMIASLGDYPARGEYETIGAEMDFFPTERMVTKAIDFARYHVARRASTEHQRALDRVNVARDRENKTDADYDSFAAQLFDDASPAFRGAPMVGYSGTHRGSLVGMAERVGIRSHPY